ncbi:MAG TPA: DUF721 domain-containing protein [Oligoflexia bacterium]|nr:DUF721 domain-containing protein [Oligoflexia bacterium]
MKNLKAILNNILDSNPYYKGHKVELQILEKWPETVGARIAQHCTPERFTDDGTLIVSSNNSAWLHQLKYLEPQIVTKLNKALGEDRIKQLRFRLR